VAQGVKSATNGYFPWVTAKPDAVVVVPAHNEFAALARCVDAVRTAASAAAVATSVVVVLDACDDDSASLAGRFGSDVRFIAVDERNVGAARAAGFRYARSVLDDVRRPRWYATTDADTEVGTDWLTRQIAANADMVLGLVRVGEWQHHSEEVASEYEARYRAEASRQQHIHGANMGFGSEAYWRVGGFASRASGEDVDLVERFQAQGYRVYWDESLWVTTSDRRNARAPGGFAEYLDEVAHEVTGFRHRTDEAS
jgi:glycosyltransferase involved in cell wall biosynthesis